MSIVATSQTVTVIRWIARLSAGLAAALIAFIFIGEGMGDGFAALQQLTGPEISLMFAFLAVWVGLLLGWHWELAGGLLIVGGTLVFYLLNFAFSGHWPGGPYFLILAAPGLLFLFCGWLARTEAIP